MARFGIQIRTRFARLSHARRLRQIGSGLSRAGLPVVLFLTTAVPAFAAAPPAPHIGHLDSIAMQAAAGDVVLGAGAATAILAGMVVVLAASWRGFRGMLQVEDPDDGGLPEPPVRRRRTKPED